MRNDTPLLYIFADRRSWNRIALGLPILISGIAILALAGWLYSGLDAAFAPAHWLRDPPMALYLVARGAMCSLLLACALYFVALFAFVIGDVLMRKAGGGARQETSAGSDH